MSEFDELMKELINGEIPPFEPHAFYNEEGNQLEILWKNSNFRGKTINRNLTLLLDIETDEVIGCIVNHMRKVLNE